MSVSGKASGLRWMDVPSTGVAMRRSQRGDSGTGPADESHRNTIGVVGLVATQDRLTSC